MANSELQIDPFKHEGLQNNIKKFSSSLTENTLHLDYKDRPFNVV